MRVDPGPSRWVFPAVDTADPIGLLAVGADLEPATLLAAYRGAVFPMPLSRRGRIGWWSPDPRGVLPLEAAHVSRSLARTRHRFEIRIDTAFDEVVQACADPDRPHGWINPAMRRAYRVLHDMGWAHSIEAWAGDETLAGGLFGISLGGLFAGESMFHRRTDASKAALLGLCDLLRSGPDGGAGRLLDVQWTTPHLTSLGAVDLPRAGYLRLLRTALEVPAPDVFS
ncbi:MAG TPA: leucyl/phenylalanyl-tRNA--protein transferase [Sporichthyaceae bacterium]|nr:leucyl/phenylalanyl-tRNA--protein transferase [Sporichthyaceae bacterium]